MATAFRSSSSARPTSWASRGRRCHGRPFPGRSRCGVPSPRFPPGGAARLGVVPRGAGRRGVRSPGARSPGARPPGADMREPTTLPISARLLILSTAAAGAFALGVRLTDAPSWTVKDVIAFAALTVAIAVAEQFSIPLRHRTETVNFSLTDGLWAAALPLARPSVLTFSVAAGATVVQVARRWAPR